SAGGTQQAGQCVLWHRQRVGGVGAVADPVEAGVARVCPVNRETGRRLDDDAGFGIGRVGGRTKRGNRPALEQVEPAAMVSAFEIYGPAHLYFEGQSEPRDFRRLVLVEGGLGTQDLWHVDLTRSARG